MPWGIRSMLNWVNDRSFLEFASSPSMVATTVQCASRELTTETACAWLRYRPREIQVTENGFSVRGENDMQLAEALNDTPRVAYFQGYVAAAVDAVNIDKVAYMKLCCTACMAVLGSRSEESDAFCRSP